MSSKQKGDKRACLTCAIIQSPSDFFARGCPNCEEVANMQGSQDRVAECTSMMYDGMIAVMSPEESWVARWQRIDKRRAGLYAVRVTGRPPTDVIEAIEAKGGVYRPRDKVDEE